MMANISYLWQLIGSMEDATAKLEKLVEKGDQVGINRLRSMILDIQKIIETEVTGGKNEK
jgi:hypothetical protein